MNEICGILRKNYSLKIINTESLLKSSDEINRLAAPFLGGDDPLFGKKCTLRLRDFFTPGALLKAVPDENADISIIAGPGAALAEWPGILIYIDIPKNEIQYRSRAGTIGNFGLLPGSGPAETYKRFYFVDWVVMNNHKREILAEIDLYADGQRPDLPVFINGEDLRRSAAEISCSPFRARPWFEPGAWGGKWMIKNIPGINKDVPNYAWSFELISPENGIIIESSSLMLEIPFDVLMSLEAKNILGSCHPAYGYEFPIRFDFLDTFSGGNLSLQCHPQPEYIKENFGESLAQEEAYYILDNAEESSVYLGFRDDIDPREFREALEKSEATGAEIDPEEFILKHSSKKHDVFLIPCGTIHGSGKNNLVLEISTTPYIFTFKMYDWVRKDLNGRLRILNIKRGMDNLCFDRKGNYAKEHLIPEPVLIERGNDWRLFDIPTHPTHSYRIHRYHFETNIELNTDNRCLVMSLTGGESIMIESANGRKAVFSFAETFIIPAAAGNIRISNNSPGEAILTMAFIK